MSIRRRARAPVGCSLGRSEEGGCPSRVPPAAETPMNCRAAIRLVMTACLAGVAACSTSDQPQAPLPVAPAPGIMSATVNGGAWGAGGVSGSAAGAAYSASPPASILIVGHRVLTDGSGSKITLHVEAFAGPGTYTLSTGALSGARAVFSTYTTAHDTTNYRTDAGHTGTLTITVFDQINRDVRGTFSFTGLEPVGPTVVNVTTGTFDVSY